MAAENDVTLITDATILSLSAAPSAATDGVDLMGADAMEIRIWSSAGSNTMTVTVRAWLYSAADARWYPASIGSGSGDAANTSGWLNGGALIEEVAADVIRHTETIRDLRSWNRLHLQTVDITGTGTTIQGKGRRLWMQANGKEVG